MKWHNKVTLSSTFKWLAAAVLCLLLTLTTYGYILQYRWGFIVAAGQGDNAAVLRYLDRGIDPNAISISNSRAIGWAASRGRYDTVKLLIARGANPTYGLHGAVQMNQAQIVNLLVSKGADVNWRGNGRLLKLAMEEGNHEMIKILKAAGAR